MRIEGFDYHFTFVARYNKGKHDNTTLQDSTYFEHEYTLGCQILGSGTNGKVVLATKSKTPWVQSACKIMGIKHKLGLLGSRERKHVLREIDVLSSLKLHPNIVNIWDFYQTDDRIYIFEELITGGDLFSFVADKGGSLDEVYCLPMVYQICHGLMFLHRNGIMHRDLKVCLNL